MGNNDTRRPSAGQFLLGNGLMLVAAIFWGFNVSVTKALIPDWMTANGITATRLIGACILFWLVSLFMTHKRIAGGDWIRLIAGGVIGLFGFVYLFVSALRFGEAIDISIIMTLPPAVILLYGAIFRHSRPSLLELAGVIISLVGAVVVILDAGNAKTGSNNLLGDLLAVASTICYAFYLIVLEGPTKTYKPVTMLRWVFLFAAIPALVLVPPMRHMPIMHTSELAPWLEIGFILLCPTFLAYFMVQPAMKRIGSELVSLYQYLVPVFATVSAVMMGISHLRAVQIVAMAIIITGMVLTNLGKRSRARRQS